MKRFYTTFSGETVDFPTTNLLLIDAQKYARIGQQCMIHSLHLGYFCNGTQAEAEAWAEQAGLYYKAAAHCARLALRRGIEVSNG